MRIHKRRLGINCSNFFFLVFIARELLFANCTTLVIHLKFSVCGFRRIFHMHILRFQSMQLMWYVCLARTVFFRLLVLICYVANSKFLAMTNTEPEMIYEAPISFSTLRTNKKTKNRKCANRMWNRMKQMKKKNIGFAAKCQKNSSRNRHKIKSRPSQEKNEI